MINVIFPNGLDTVRVDAVDQWDHNRSLVISGMEKTSGAQQVHFYNKFSKEAVRRIAYVVGDNYEVTIPNSLLREEYDITAAVYMNTYVQRPFVNIQTKGVYYTRTWKTGGYYSYTAHTLPDEYSSNATYYQRVGETVKKVIIPVIPRAKPCDCVDMEDPTDEDIIAELMQYCSTLNEKVDAATEEAFRERFVILSQEEYNTLAAEGRVEEDVLYCIENTDLYEDIKNGIASGDIVIQRANEANHATEADNADTANGITVLVDEATNNIDKTEECIGFKQGEKWLPVIAQHSDTANTAKEAARATLAEFADNAEYAEKAGEAAYSTNAGYAYDAATCHTATYALEAELIADDTPTVVSSTYDGTKGMTVPITALEDNALYYVEFSETKDGGGDRGGTIVRYKKGEAICLTYCGKTYKIDTSGKAVYGESGTIFTTTFVKFYKIGRLG